MTFMPRVEAANSAEWPDLVDELDRWEEAGRVAALWWRDDDAVAPTPNLYRLLEIAGGAPLALAVIPADATLELASTLRWFPQVAVIHHGWCHANHAAAGKKSEYPADRHPVDVADELDEGRKHLHRLFDRRALPVFVPPWNRFAERFVPLLAEAGFKAISQMAPRGDNGPRRRIGGFAVIDVDLDVTAWHEERAFLGEAVALDRLAALLRARREAADDTAIGVLTHHLVMDSATEDFLARLNQLVAAHSAVRWDGINGLLP
jgi:peptidoglycan/xylan/chitin deacetylase (PgdA/CDA1 family)